MQPRRTASFEHTAALLIVALLAICIAPALAAAMPTHAGDFADCGARLCQEGACNTATVSMPGLPAVPLGSTSSIGVPVAVLMPPPATRPVLAPPRPLSPLAPRSPPLV